MQQVERVGQLEQQLEGVRFKNLQLIDQLRQANSEKNEVSFKFVHLQEEF